MEDTKKLLIVYQLGKCPLLPHSILESVIISTSGRETKPRVLKPIRFYMKLTPIAANQTELTLNNGTQVFFSYKTPVAAYDSVSGKFLRTSYKWSVTTTRHINKWLDTRIAQECDQSVLDSLVN